MEVIFKIIVVSITIPFYVVGYTYKSIETWFKIGYEDNSKV